MKSVRAKMSVRSDLKKLDSFTFETSKNHLIRYFLRNGRLRVKYIPEIRRFINLRTFHLST